MPEITMLIPHDEGTPEASAIQVYLGKLTLGQLVQLALKGGEAYPQHAVVEFYNEDGTLDGVQVTFNNQRLVEPVSVREHFQSGALRATGYEFNDETPGTGHLMYTSEFTQTYEAPAS